MRRSSGEISWVVGLETGQEVPGAADAPETGQNEEDLEVPFSEMPFWCGIEDEGFFSVA